MPSIAPVLDELDESYADPLGARGQAVRREVETVVVFDLGSGDEILLTVRDTEMNRDEAAQRNRFDHLDLHAR